MAIYFYSTNGQHGPFSNFSAHPFRAGGVTWPTSEHYFHARKFDDKDYREQIRAARSPTIAGRLGRSRKIPIRSDWEEIKDDTMYRAVLAKFHAHSDPEDAAPVHRAGRDRGTDDLARVYGNQKGVYFDGESGFLMSAAEAATLATEDSSDALFSLAPGKCVLFFDHDGSLWVCER